jgi:hypothetical protein
LAPYFKTEIVKIGTPSITKTEIVTRQKLAKAENMIPTLRILGDSRKQKIKPKVEMIMFTSAK